MNTVYFHSDDTISFPVVEGVSIHALNEDVFYTLESDVAIDIWNLINGSNSVQEIIEFLMKDYMVEESTLKEDVTNFIGTLLENSLIQKK